MTADAPCCCVCSPRRRKRRDAVPRIRRRCLRYAGRALLADEGLMWRGVSASREAPRRSLRGRNAPPHQTAQSAAVLNMRPEGQKVGDRRALWAFVSWSPRLVFKATAAAQHKSESALAGRRSCVVADRCRKSGRSRRSSRPHVRGARRSSRRRESNGRYRVE